MSLFQKYLTLAPKTRIVIGVSVMAYASAALFLTDMSEEKFGMKATEEDFDRLRGSVPRISTIEKGALDGEKRT